MTRIKFFQENNNASNLYAPLQVAQTNILWDHFKYFELTEIMRQRNDLKWLRHWQLLVILV